MADVVFRPISTEEYPAYIRSMAETFGEDIHPDDVANEQAIWEADRSQAGFDGDEVIATAGIITRELTVPGGTVPMAGVTDVSVAPTHRRRGILTELMRNQLTSLHEDQREPVATLYASEGGIYGRFGYGLATLRGRQHGPLRRLGLRPGTDTGAGRVRTVRHEVALPAMRALYERLRPGQVGWLNRDDVAWGYRLYDPEHGRGGATALRYALNTEDDGRVSGYAVYSIKADWPDINDNRTAVRITEIVAEDARARASLWSFLINLDLVAVLERVAAPVDDPLRWQLADPRGLDHRVFDAMWLRIADVDRALAARRYAVEVDVVLAVTDPFCPWNAGRWRLAGGPDGAACTRTSDPADLALSSTELGTAYLGGTGLAESAAAGLVAELRPGALAAAHRAFVGAVAPHCPEMF
jgi:predicted acetyltransferase